MGFVFQKSTLQTLQRVLLFLASLAFCSTLSAQKRDGKPAKQETPLSPGTVKEYFSAYEFDKIIEALAAESQDSDSLASKAELGQNMLQGIRRVEFLDSIVLDKNKFLEAIGRKGFTGKLTLSDSLVCYENDFGDVRIVCRPDAHGRIFLSREHRIGNSWQSIASVPDDHQIEKQNYPYLMPDGRTLYFAECGNESLGGYDIFVTRYDAESKQFSRAENIGMPFNSPANDYMYVVDEISRLGWFVTDRRQPEGKVCVFIFRPSGTYETVTYDEAHKDEAIRIAQIPPFDIDPSYQKAIHQSELQRQLFIVIDNRTVYTDLSQFRNDEARTTASEWLVRKEELALAIRKLDDMRLAFHTNPDSRAAILQQEALVRQLKASTDDLAKKMRQAEIQ